MAWLGAAGVAAGLVLQRSLPNGVLYNPLERCFTMPGNWVPLMLIMGIFLTTYGVGVATSLSPALARNANFGMCLGTG